MNYCSIASFHLALFIPFTLLAVSMNTAIANAQASFYKPMPIVSGKTLTDKLTNKDLPTGQGGFARDYVLPLKEGDQVSIDLTSENFDTLVTLIGNDGSTVAENDDGPDGSTNSLLFTRITKTGNYFIRVRAFGELAGGNFKLKVTQLKPL
ncbi:PPC domain-containing protein [Phormidium sp. FACHB-592]|nr:PPC domain-containing protein [Leptolyngbya sp. FACHB-321]MBD2073165.1 PPC domain-containing protein [Phormidium sp. FACHB-592]